MHKSRLSVVLRQMTTMEHVESFPSSCLWSSSSGCSLLCNILCKCLPQVVDAWLTVPCWLGCLLCWVCNIHHSAVLVPFHTLSRHSWQTPVLRAAKGRAEGFLASMDPVLFTACVVLHIGMYCTM